MKDYIEQRIKELQGETAVNLTKQFHQKLKTGIKPTHEELLREYPEFQRLIWEDGIDMPEEGIVLYACPEFLREIAEDDRAKATDKYYFFDSWCFSGIWENDFIPNLSRDCVVEYAGDIFNPKWMVSFDAVVAMRRALVEKHK